MRKKDEKLILLTTQQNKSFVSHGPGKEKSIRKKW